MPWWADRIHVIHYARAGFDTDTANFRPEWHDPSLISALDCDNTGRPPWSTNARAELLTMRMHAPSPSHCVQRFRKEISDEVGLTEYSYQGHGLLDCQERVFYARVLQFLDHHIGNTAAPH